MFVELRYCVLNSSAITSEVYTSLSVVFSAMSDVPYCFDYWYDTKVICTLKKISINQALISKSNLVSKLLKFSEAIFEQVIKSLN